mmetsp:Transcript_23529/g.36807  ORF Transcript_23529/g.36807 Transcript_23529/m.36807 type:complete len:276 (+) Transcript_23529:188-1015(+)
MGGQLEELRAEVLRVNDAAHRRFLLEREVEELGTRCRKVEEQMTARAAKHQAKHAALEQLANKLRALSAAQQHHQRLQGGSANHKPAETSRDSGPSEPQQQTQPSRYTKHPPAQHIQQECSTPKAQSGHPAPILGPSRFEGFEIDRVMPAPCQPGPQQPQPRSSQASSTHPAPSTRHTSNFHATTPVTQPHHSLAAGDTMEGGEEAEDLVSALLTDEYLMDKASFFFDRIGAGFARAPQRERLQLFRCIPISHSCMLLSSWSCRLAFKGTRCWIL